MKFSIFLTFFIVFAVTTAEIKSGKPCPICSPKPDPVCAQHINGTSTTFINHCILDIANCEVEDYKFLYKGKCQS
ncbi:hypothetical protein PVAND_000168 [Polypedilum vanderplanki]|uniref:Kazal-like domain-containing protein n=1 Tax=Polypedilum vanderplanki TaxID=319348 RepID=A0A9J6BJ85_POLVA|nr:hypothetical protein PVAND_000168 [Polypedilum vanderplanki]